MSDIRKTVLLDIDGVLTNFLPHWLNYISVYSGIDLKEEDVTHWHLHRTTAVQKMHLGMQEIRSAFYDVFDIPGFWRSMPLFPGARDFIKNPPWRHTLVLVSAPSGPDSAKEKMEYVTAVFGKNKPKLILTEEKHLVRGDIFVDDHPGNCLRWLDANPNGKAYCPETPYRDNELKGNLNEFRDLKNQQGLNLLGPMTDPDAFKTLRNIITADDPKDFD